MQMGERSVENFKKSATNQVPCRAETSRMFLAIRVARTMISVRAMLVLVLGVSRGDCYISCKHARKHMQCFVLSYQEGELCRALIIASQDG